MPEHIHKASNIQSMQRFLDRHLIWVILLSSLLFFLLVLQKSLIILIIFACLDIIKSLTKSRFKVDITIDFITIGAIILAANQFLGLSIILAVFPIFTRLFEGRFRFELIFEFIALGLICFITEVIPPIDLFAMILIGQTAKFFVEYLIEFLVLRTLDLKYLYLKFLILFGDYLFLSLFLVFFL